MKSSAVKILSFLLTFCFAAASYAGGCYLDTVDRAKYLASDYLGNLVRNKVLEIESKMNAKGEKLSVVLVARRGENMGGFKIYKDDPSVPLGKYIYQLDKAVRTYEQNAENENGRSTELPDSFFSNHKLIYSHMGLLLRRYKDIPDSQDPENWVYAKHLLAQCDKKSKRYGKSNIYPTYLDQFFWDTKVLDPSDDSVLIIVPKPELQARLAQLLLDRKISYDAIHDPTYNVASVPFRFRDPNDLNKPDPFFTHYQVNDQNSNQWPLELIAAAELPPNTPIVNRIPSQDELWKTNYRPTLVRANSFFDSIACAFRRGPILPWGGHMWDASNLLNCFDQTFRPDNVYQLITVDSVVSYLERNNLMADNVDQPGQPGVYEIKADKETILERATSGKYLDDLPKYIHAVNNPNDNQ